MPKSVVFPDFALAASVFNWVYAVPWRTNETSDMYLLWRAYVRELQCPLSQSQRMRFLLQPLGWNGRTQSSSACRT